MEFKWQHTEWLYAAPLLLLVVIISAVFFQRWRHKVWRILGLSDRSQHASAALSKARFIPVIPSWQWQWPSYASVWRTCK